jgi:hypothetical protein
LIISAADGGTTDVLAAATLSISIIMIQKNDNPIAAGKPTFKNLFMA